MQFAPFFRVHIIARRRRRIISHHHHYYYHRSIIVLCPPRGADRPSSAYALQPRILLQQHCIMLLLCTCNDERYYTLCGIRDFADEHDRASLKTMTVLFRGELVRTRVSVIRARGRAINHYYTRYTYLPDHLPLPTASRWMHAVR